MVINKSKDIVGDIPRIPTVYPVQDKEYAPIESLRLREEKSDNDKENTKYKWKFKWNLWIAHTITLAQCVYKGINNK